MIFLKMSIKLGFAQRGKTAIIAIYRENVQVIIADVVEHQICRFEAHEALIAFKNQVWIGPAKFDVRIENGFFDAFSAADMAVLKLLQDQLGHGALLDFFVSCKARFHAEKFAAIGACVGLLTQRKRTEFPLVVPHCFAF